MEPLDVRTPALALDIGALERNLARMADECRTAGVALRPHTKTHKSPWIAALQIRRGARGVCVAKAQEAQVLADAGIDDILLTTPLSTPKIAALIDLAERVTITVVVDDIEVARRLAQEAASRGMTIPVLIDLEVGQGRTGVRDADDATRIAAVLTELAGVSFGGVQGYEGHLQHAAEGAQKRASAFAAYDRIARSCEGIRAAGFDVACVSTAGTGTYRLAVEHGLATEVQPGSYVFMDSHYGSVLHEPFEQAIHVITGVVSRAPSGRLTVDAGSKAISTEAGMPSVIGDSPTSYEIAGDEFGIVDGLPSATEQVWLVPSHCDTTVNLHSEYLLTRGNRVIGTLPVAGRGALR
jgi:D-serine deaminase-like pyridoxal phosphate-dependent protein